MRLFCELFLVAVLIWLGWTKSFQDRINQMRGIERPPTVAAHQMQVRQAVADGSVATAATAPAPRQPFLRAPPAPTPSGDWMWDPAHRNPLDRSSYKSGDTSAQEAAQRSSQNYWIDARGVRHYTSGGPPPPAASP
jgi:hypothetical protein